MRLRKIRRLEAYEYDVLPTFLYNSIYQSEDADLLELSVIEEDRYSKYIKDFGKETDYAIVWELDGRIAGIAWTRLFQKCDESLGFLDEQIPELTLSVLAGYDEQLIGPELIEIIFNESKLQGFTEISVALDKDNDLTDMYTKLGFGEPKTCKDGQHVLYTKHLM